MSDHTRENLLRLMAAGGLSMRNLTRKVPVTGSARGATSRTTPVAVTWCVNGTP
jgi:hypothetical protein